MRLPIIFLLATFLIANSKPQRPIFKEAIFAGGCFWCMEAAFEKLEGVKSVVSGYSGGHKKNPKYKEVAAGKTGHKEVVKVTFDSNKINYEKLLVTFWLNVDPTVKDKQFCDVGSQYASGIFYLNQKQKYLAEKSFERLKAIGFKNIHTSLEEGREFFQAEENHQDYYKKNPVRYKFYTHGCGRKKRLEEVWKGKSLQ